MPVSMLVSSKPAAVHRSGISHSAPGGLGHGLTAYAACRFFTHTDDFNLEVELYGNELIRETLPELIHATANADGSVRSRSGFKFPPFMVLERGASMAECAAHRSCNARHAAAMQLFVRI